MTVHPESRFWAKVEITNQCWLWKGGRVNDPHGGPPYGAFSISAKKKVGAHRFAYESQIGPIPEGLVIDHLCRNRLCVNPDHLEAVTTRENVMRQDRTGTDTHCPHGQEFTEENTYWAGPGRQCRICKAAAFKRFADRRRANAH